MKKRITDDFFKEYVNTTHMKPNGSGLFSFVRYDTDMENDRYISDLYLFDMDAGKVKERLTYDGSAGAHQWLDAENLVILGARDQADKDMIGKGIPLAVFYKFNIITKEYTKLFSLHKGIYDFRIIDENRFLLLSSENAIRESWLHEAGGDWEKYAEIAEIESRYFIADEVPFWTNDGGYCNKERGRVYFYDRSGGFCRDMGRGASADWTADPDCPDGGAEGSLIRLSGDDISIFAIDSYKDKYGIFYGVDSGGMQKTEGKVYKIDYSTMEVTAIDDSNLYVYAAIQAVDESRILLCRSDRALHGEYQNGYIDILDMDTGIFTRNNKHADIHFYDNVLTDVTYLSGWLNKITVTENGIIYISTRGGDSKLYFSPFGSDHMTELTHESGKILDYFADGDKIYMSAMRGLDGGEFYMLDPVSGTELRLTDFNTALKDEFQFPQIQSCDFVNSDGITIQGWAMKPAVFEDGKKYPAILFIHGLPNLQFGAR